MLHDTENPAFFLAATIVSQFCESAFAPGFSGSRTSCGTADFAAHAEMAPTASSVEASSTTMTRPAPSARATATGMLAESPPSVRNRPPSSCGRKI